jgi:hypothetical protein
MASAITAASRTPMTLHAAVPRTSKFYHHFLYFRLEVHVVNSAFEFLLRIVSDNPVVLNEFGSSTVTSLSFDSVA